MSSYPSRIVCLTEETTETLSKWHALPSTQASTWPKSSKPSA